MTGQNPDEAGSGRNVKASGVTRRFALMGMGSAALAGVFMPAVVSRAKAQGKYKLDLGGYSGPELTTQPITLRFMRQEYTPATNEAVAKALAQFKEAYPNITVAEERVPYGDLQKKLLVYVGSGDAPDIMMGRTDFSAAYHAGKMALPLQDYFDPAYLADIPDNLRAVSEVEGNLYCVPWETNVLMMYFNKDLFKKAGVPTPPEPTEVDGGWTIEQYIDTLAELTKKLRAQGDSQTWALSAASLGNGGPGANYTQLESFWIRSQGDPNAPKDSSLYKTFQGVSDDGRSVSGYIDSPEAVQGIRHYQRLFTDGLTPLGAVPNQWRGGIAASHLTSLVWAHRFLTPGQEPEFGWGLSALPKGKVLFNPADSDAPLVWSKSPYPAEAVALLAFLCNDANRIAYHRTWGSLPSRRSLVKAMPEYDQRQPYQLALAHSAISTRAPHTAGYFDYYNAMNPAVKDIALGADAEATLKATAEKLDRSLAKYR